MTKSDLILLLKEIIAGETGISLTEIGDTDTFFSLGLDSVSCIYLLDKVEDKLNLALNPIHLFDYPSIDSYAGFLLEELTHHGR
jgi:acyl carrier protein